MKGIRISISVIFISVIGFCSAQSSSSGVTLEFRPKTHSTNEGDPSFLMPENFSEVVLSIAVPDTISTEGIVFELVQQPKKQVVFRRYYKMEELSALGALSGDNISLSLGYFQDAKKYLLNAEFKNFNGVRIAHRNKSL